MGEKETVINLIEEHIKRSDQSLRSAQILLDENLFDDSISRSYYAVYHLIRAILFSIGEESKTHKGQLNSLYLHFVKTNKIDKSLHKRIASLFNLRGDADYGTISLFDENDAKEAYTIAEDVKSVILRLIKEFINKG